jgi:hypothetical protein
MKVELGKTIFPDEYTIEALEVERDDVTDIRLVGVPGGVVSHGASVEYRAHLPSSIPAFVDIPRFSDSLREWLGPLGVRVGDFHFRSDIRPDSTPSIEVAADLRHQRMRRKSSESVVDFRDRAKAAAEKLKASVPPGAVQATTGELLAAVNRKLQGSADNHNERVLQRVREQVWGYSPFGGSGPGGWMRQCMAEDEAFLAREAEIEKLKAKLDAARRHHAEATKAEFLASLESADWVISGKRLSDSAIEAVRGVLSPTDKETS